MEHSPVLSQVGSRGSITSDLPGEIIPIEEIRPLSKSEVTNKSIKTTNGSNRSINGSYRKGRFSSIVSNINPLPALGFRRRKDSKDEIVPVSIRLKESQSSSGFTAVASQIEDDFEPSVSLPSEPRKRDCLSQLHLDPNTISEETWRRMRNSSNTKLYSSPEPTPRSMSTPPDNIYLSPANGNRPHEMRARGSRENTPEGPIIHSLPKGIPGLNCHSTSEPGLLHRANSRTRNVRGNRGHYKRREKERNRPTVINTLLPLEDLSFAVVVFLVAWTLADLTGKVLSSIGTTLFFAIGLSQWAQVKQHRNRQKRMLHRTGSRGSRRSRRRMRKEAAVLDIS